MSDLVDDSGFFAPTSSDLFDNILAQYRRDLALIKETAEIINGPEVGQIMDCFIDGNTCPRRDRGFAPDTERLFSAKGAVAALNSRYWKKALSLTDVMDYMPQKRRDEWREQITGKSTPDFEEETVRPTLLNLLGMRSQFLAEKVDGIFRALSGEHVTNQPQAFSKRMIFHIRCDLGLISWRNEGHLNDLRAIIAKFMGRDEPRHGSMSPVLDAAYRHVGEWLEMDGGAMRIRVYLKGTAHIEIHPEMAWRLNSILASLYPSTIPESLRRKPVKRKKKGTWREIETPLAFEIIHALTNMGRRIDEKTHPWQSIKRKPNTLAFSYGATKDKHVRKKVAEILELIGGVRTDDTWDFGYDPTEVIEEIASLGMVPDSISYQFYPTPAELAVEAVKRAEITEDHDCLEPSAGTGNLAKLMTHGKSLMAMELSDLHCHVLKTKGFQTLQGDFLDWYSAERFDRIVMNPPYSQGRWQRHLEHAAGMLRAGGRVVAILPESARGKVHLPNFSLSWSESHKSMFKNASISTVILTADKV